MALPQLWSVAREQWPWRRKAPGGRNGAPRWPGGIGAATVVLGCVIFLGGVLERRQDTLDDAYITFRFGQRLAEGNGLRWNVDGPPVDGSTSLLHVLAAAGAVALGLNPESMTWGLSLAAVLATAGLMLAALRLVFGAVRPAAACAVGIYLADPVTAIHATSGLETQLFVLLAFGAYVLALRLLTKPGLPAATALAGCVFLAVLCRPEGVLIGGAVLAVLGVNVAACGLGGRLAPGQVRSFLLAVALLAILGTALAAGKLAYFGYLLPNSYYVKSNQLSLVGLGKVARFCAHTALWLGPLAVGACLLCPLRRLAGSLRFGRARVLVALTVAPPAVLLTYYCTTMHEVGWAHRFSYPALAYAAMAVGALCAVAGAMMPSWRGALFRPGAPAIVCCALVAVGGLGLWPPRIKPISPFMDYHRSIASALEATGLGPGGKVITIAAGIIPYQSRFSHVDPVGLTDNFMSGRTGASTEQREQYLWDSRADVYIGFEPPASPGATGWREDQRMLSRYVSVNLLRRRLRTIESRYILQDPALLHRRMRELRDNWHWAGEMDWAGWPTGRLKCFIYVREASPHRQVLLEATRRLVARAPEQVSLN